MDREKFTQEVLKSENTMYHIAKGMLKSESDCEDVVSEAVLQQPVRHEADEAFLRDVLCSSPTFH